MSVTENNKRIAKNTIFLYFRLAIVMIVNLYATRVVLNVLGVSDYGVYNVVCGFVAMFSFLNTSMANGVQRFYNFELGKGGARAITQVYNTALIIQIILAIIILALTETIGLWYLNTKMVISPDRIVAANWIFQFSVISLVFVIIQIPYSAAILAYERMNYYAIVSVVDALLKLAIVLILPYIAGDSLIIYGLLIMLISIFNFILYWIYCHNNFRHLTFEKRFDKTLFKSMMSFSGWNLFGSFAYILKGQGVNVLINVFFGTVVNAANGIAAQVSSAIQTFSTNLVIAFPPQLTQSYAAGNYVRTEQLMLSMSKISFGLMCVIAIPIIVEIDYILEIWLKSDIPQYTNTFTVLTIVSIMVGVLNAPITQVIHATGKMKKYQIATSVVICSILPISWLFLKLGYGATSVFVITIFIMAINQIVCLWVLHSIFRFNVKEYIKTVILPCVIITIIPLSAVSYLCNIMPSTALRFVFIAIVNLLMIAILFYLTMNSSEKNTIKMYINKFKLKYAKENH